MLIRQLFGQWTNELKLEAEARHAEMRVMKPQQVRLNIAKAQQKLNAELAADKELAKLFDSIKVELPSLAN